MPRKNRNSGNHRKRQGSHKEQEAWAIPMKVRAKPEEGESVGQGGENINAEKGESVEQES